MSELQGLMRTAWHGSLLHRFVAFWQNCWSASAVRGFLVWLMSLPYPYERSRAHEGLARLNRRLAGADRARNAIYTSRVHRAWAAVARVGRGSRLLGWVFLLLILALYTPIDYFLRDVFAIPGLSSGWDEGLLLLALVWVVVVRIKDRPALPPADSPLDLPVAQFLAVCVALFFVTMRLVPINVAGIRANDPDQPILLGGKVAMLNADGTLAVGDADTTLTSERLSELYGTELHLVYVEKVDRVACVSSKL